MRIAPPRAFVCTVILLGCSVFTAAQAQTDLSPAEARAIAKEAYIYALPMVDNYRIQYAYFVDRASPEYKAPWNQIRNIPRVYTPADTAIQTPNSDGGSFLIAGPGWKGETPKGVKEVIRAETELVLAGYRTQLFNPADLDNVKKIQAGYKVQTLSAFLGQPAP